MFTLNGYENVIYGSNRDLSWTNIGVFRTPYDQPFGWYSPESGRNSEKKTSQKFLPNKTTFG